MTIELTLFFHLDRFDDLLGVERCFVIGNSLVWWSLFDFLDVAGDMLFDYIRAGHHVRRAEFRVPVLGAIAGSNKCRHIWPRFRSSFYVLLVTVVLRSWEIKLSSRDPISMVFTVNVDEITGV